MIDSNILSANVPRAMDFSRQAAFLFIIFQFQMLELTASNMGYKLHHPTSGHVRRTATEAPQLSSSAAPSSKAAGTGRQLPRAAAATSATLAHSAATTKASSRRNPGVLGR
jgi:hypothetical protein